MSSRRPFLPAVDLARLGLLVGLGVVSVSGMGCKRSRMPPRLDGAAVVVAEGTTESGLAAVDEVEPNDALANAQPLAPTAEQGVAVAGRLLSSPGGKAKDVDLYRVTVPAPSVVTAEADAAAPPPRQRLAVEVRPEAGQSVSVDALDDQGKVLVASVGVTAGDAEGIPNLAVIPGTYFIRVKPGAASTSPGAHADAGAGGGGTYRLAVRLQPFEPGEEIEPNGKGALAGEVAASGDVAGFLGWRHDEDWFRLPLAGLPEGSVLSVDLDPPEGVAVSVAIADSVEHKMTEQHGRRGDRVAIRNVRLPPSEPAVFVVVRAESGRNLDGRYGLRLRTEEAKADSELEPNDDVAHAVPMEDGTFLGYLGSGDVDIYRYASPAPVELDFEVSPPERVDLKIEVLREDGSVLSKVDAGKRREAERLANLYVGGPVLLRLSAAKGDGNLDEPYRIRASSRPLEPGAEREPNGTAATATALPPGVTGTGLIFPRGDTDFWLVQTPAGPAGGAAIVVRPVPGLAIEARVRTTSGKDLTKFKVSGDVPEPTRVTAGADDCCLIQIREVSGRGANPRDRYSLSVSP
ncbi:MAG: hypothetical protein ABUL67_03355 [Haliangium ochraceum]